MPLIILIVLSLLGIFGYTIFNESVYENLDTNRIKDEAIMIVMENKGNYGRIRVTENTPTILNLADSVHHSEYGISITLYDGVIFDSDGLIIPIGEKDVTTFPADVKIELSNGVYQWIWAN